eukprot:8108089-Prorocentrum_lima.AAC.1
MGGIVVLAGIWSSRTQAAARAGSWSMTSWMRSCSHSHRAIASGHWGCVAGWSRCQAVLCCIQSARQRTAGVGQC